MLQFGRKHYGDTLFLTPIGTLLFILFTPYW